MTEMIERYIYYVIRRLPEKERGEVRRELEASISDMLPDNPNEQDTINVLTKLGTPASLQNNTGRIRVILFNPPCLNYISRC